MTFAALKNPIAVLMASILVVVFAVVVVPRMSVDTFPELTPPVLVIGTLAPGLGPKDVEKTITWRIEKYVSATPGVDHVQSLSRNNIAIIFVWLKWGTDLNAAQGLVQQQVAFAMSAVPKTLGVIPPFVLQYDPSNAPVVQVAVSGEGLTGARIYDFAQNNIEPALEGIEGVASASPNGGRTRMINVVVDPAAARARGITSSDVAAAVSSSNALLPSGSFVSPLFDANIYTNAVAERLEHIADAIVKKKDGKPVAIKDVAQVIDGASPQTQAVSIDGKDAVYLNVLRVPGGNTLAIVDQVKHKLKELEPTLPPGMKVTPIFDQSTFVRATYDGLKREVLQALILISLVILLFLQSGRSVLIAAVAIPISFGAILIVLYATGNTLNAFTLGGLTLAMGPLVDISVVVLESVHRHRKDADAAQNHGHAHAHDPDLAGPAAYAALEGTRSVAVPALAATMTTIAVLLPVLLLAGLAKKLFAPLALTVATAMVAGYIVSMTVTPVACKFLLKKHSEPGRIAARVEHLVQALAERYARLLRAVLATKGVLVAGVAVMVVAAVLTATKLPSQFFPAIDEGMERVYVRLAPGLSIEQASSIMNDMGKTIADELPKGTVTLYLANVGYPKSPRSALGSPNNGPHMGFLRFELAPLEERALSQGEIADRIRAIIATKFPGVETLQWPGGLVASVFANGFNAPLVVEMHGNDLKTLADEERAVAEVARTVPGVRDVFPTLDNDYPEVRLRLDRQEAGMVDVTARTLAQTALESTFGNINTPSTWVDPQNGMAYYVVTQYDSSQIPDTTALSSVPLRIGANGDAVELGAYASIERSTGAVAVERNNLQRVAHVQMQTEGIDIGTAAAALEKKLQSDPRTAHIAWKYVGQIDLMRTTFGGLGVALALAVMVVFMIMASQFKSLRLPFVMLFTIPASLVGIVLALMAANEGLSITALMGMLMVIGIAASNGILLVDEANARLRAGAVALEAVVGAARVRVIPILMTSLATIVGLLPTALGLDPAAASNRPLALAVVGGLTSSTALSLFLVPAMFLFIVAENRRR